MGEREQRMAKYLNHKFLEWQYKSGRQRSQVEFCRWIGIPPTSYSNWINETRLPVGTNIYKLADKLGPEIYDILGEPRRMPTERKINWLVNAWFDGTLDEEAKEKIWQIANEGKAGEIKVTA